MNPMVQPQGFTPTVAHYSIGADNLDKDPIATTDAPGVLSEVLQRGEEMLAALSTQELLRRIAEAARPQVVGPNWLTATE